MPNPPLDYALNFSGHESFPLRFSWLSKGYKSICDDSRFFGHDDSMIDLGVGKNMVSAIRHWGLTVQAWEEIPDTRGKELRPTEFGKGLFGKWDPFLEHAGTYWALHWNTVTNPFKATTWEIALNRPTTLFTPDALLQEVQQHVEDKGERIPSSATLRRDIEVFKRSYLLPEKKKGVFQDDELDCPFKQLGLLRPAVKSGEFELIAGARPSLPQAVFEYALLKHMQKKGSNERALASVEDLLYGLNSPGRVFRLTESALLDRLHLLTSAKPSQYLIDETVGLRQFIAESNAPQPLQALRSYYTNFLEPSHV
jgi:hypothetical protein